MPLPTNKSRPSLPYQPDQSLPNNHRFGLLGNRPPTAEMLDAEFNSLQDDINILAGAINDVEAGNIPGASDPLNANKVLKTDGQGNLSFTLVNSNQLAPQAIVEASLAPQSVTTIKLGEAAVTSAKLAPKSVLTRHLAGSAVTTEELADKAITSAKLADESVQTRHLEAYAVKADELATGAVTTEKLADLAVTTAKITNAAVTTQKIGLGAVTTNELANAAVTQPKIASKAVQISNIDAQGSATSTVLMATGSGNVSFNKISGSSFDGSLIQAGAVLGSLNGYSLVPVGGLLFCIFQILSGSDSSLKWKGFNIREATCVYEEFQDSYKVTATYKRRSPGHLLCFIANNVYSPTFTETGFTYLAPSSGTASYIFLALLPDGN